VTERQHSLDELLSEVRHDQDRLLEDAERRESVRRRLAIQEPVTESVIGLRRKPVLVTSLAVAAAAALLAIVWFPGLDDAPLAYAVEGESRPTGEFLSTRPDESMTLQFSEGSRVELEPETTARVEQLTRRGARLSLEHGVAEVSVHHDDDTDWQIQSGPYVVHVVGTRFRISWDATRRDFDLQMHEGEVRVEGPFGQRSLRAGQSMNIESESGGPATDVATLGPSEASEPTPVPATVPTPAVPGPTQAPAVTATENTRVSPSPRGGVVPQSPSWRRELEAGQPAAALRAIENMGSVRARATAQELRALSTAARRARSPLEPQIYAAIRSRFAGSPDAADAAFLSGRRAQAASRHAEADRWFRTYLSEAPGGRWAAEASGRRLETLRAQGLRDAASRWAGQYLRRYPHGAHAPLARSLHSSE